MLSKVKSKLFNGQTIYVGIDVHLKSWKVAIYGEEYEHKVFSQDPEPEKLVNYLEGNFPGGEYRAVYESISL